MCFVRTSEQTGTFPLYMLNWLVFITEVGSVYRAVQTESLCKTDYVSIFKGLMTRVGPKHVADIFNFILYYDQLY